MYSEQEVMLSKLDMKFIVFQICDCTSSAEKIPITSNSQYSSEIYKSFMVDETVQSFIILMEFKNPLFHMNIVLELCQVDASP